MTQIREIHIVNHRLDPTETVLHIFVEVENLKPTTEIRGRLTGPRCQYASTVEIAYPMSELERSDQITLGVVIPEPSWWDPDSPFLYEGPLELWRDGRLCERIEIKHAIYWLQMTSKGLRLNGRPFLLRGKIVEPTCSDAEMTRLHDAAFNLVVTTRTGVDPDLRSLGFRYGLFVSFERNDGFITSDSIEHDLDILEDSRLQNRNAMQSSKVTSNAPSSPNASFMILREEELSSRGESDASKIVLTKHLPDPLPARTDVIGWIESAS
jgi:hypothetical protein